MYSFELLSLAASLSTALAATQGFNYGSTFTDSSAKQQSDFQSEFAVAKALAGTNGAFSSARLYTTIQAHTAQDPISAIPAAVVDGTSLLLGIWGSGGQATIDNEIAALKTAISKYGSSFTSLVTGISVGSEDLYRISPTGIAAKSGAGADPSVLAGYIGQVRKAIAGTGLSSVPVGHVDTWTAWVNGSNSAVVDACDFIGMDAYPYFQNSMANDITQASSLFFNAFDATKAAVNGKPVWVTETGWPVSGPIENQADPSIANAKTYWDEVGCKLFGSTTTYWYTVQDAAPTTPSPSFGLVASNSKSPLYDLTCSAVSSSSSAVASSSSSAPASSVAASAAASGTATAANIGSPGLAPFSTSGSGAAATVTTAPVASSSVASGSVVVVTSVAGNGTVATFTSVVGPAASGSGNAGPTPSVKPTSPISNIAAANMGSFGGLVIAAVAALAAF